MSIVIDFEQQNLDGILAKTKALIAAQKQLAEESAKAARGGSKGNAGAGYKQQEQAVKSLSDRLRQFTSDNLKLANTLNAPLSVVRQLNKEFGATPGKILPVAQRFQELQKAGASSADAFKVLSREAGITQKQFQALGKAAGFSQALKDAEAAAKAQVKAAKEAEAAARRLATEQAKLAKQASAEQIKAVQQAEREAIAAARAQEKAAQQAAAAQAKAAREAEVAQRKSFAEAAKAAESTRNEILKLSSTLGQGFNSARSFADRLGLSPGDTNRAIQQLRQLQRAGLSVEEQFSTLNRGLGLNKNQFNQLSKEVRQADNRLQAAGKSGKSFSSVVAGFAAAGAFAALQGISQAIQSAQQALVGFIKEALNANLQIRQLENALQSVFLQQGASVAESIRLTGEALQFVRETADATGQSFQVASKAYTQLSTAAQTSGVSQQELNALFTETNRVFGVFGLSAERADLAFSAITQILGKGQLSLEELRQQLGESLPIALRATADGLGVTTGELIKLISTGQVSGREFATAFTKGLSTIPGQVNKTQASINALNNQFFFLSAEVGKALEPIQSALLQLAADVLKIGVGEGAFDALRLSAENFQRVLEENPQIAEELGRALERVVEVATGSLSNALDNISATLEQNPEIVQEWADKLIEVADAVNGLVTLIFGIVGAVGAASDAIARAFEGNLTGIQFFDNALKLLIDTLKPYVATFTVIGDALQFLNDKAPKDLKPAFDGAAASAGSLVTALDAMNPKSDKVVESVKDIQADATKAADDIEKTASEATTRIAEAQAAGTITAEEANAQRLAAEKEAADARVKLAQKTLERIKAAAAAERAAAQEAADKALTEALNQAKAADAALAAAQASGKGDTKQLENAKAQADKRLQIAQDNVEALKATENEVPDDVKTAEAEVTKTRKEAADANIAVKENEVESAKKLEEDRLKDLKEKFDKADQIIEQSQAKRERSVLQLEQALRAQGKSEEDIAQQVGQAQLKATEQSIRDQIKLAQEKTQAFAKGTDEQAQAEIELANLQNDLLSNQIEQEKAAREAQIQAIEDAATATQQANESELANIDRILQARDNIIQSLERQNELIKAQVQLQNSVLDAQAQVTDRGIKEAESALESRRRISEIDAQLNSDNEISDEERKKLTEERARLENQIRRDGFAKNATEQQIAQELVKRTQERFAQEQRALELRQAIARNELEFEIQKDIIAAIRAKNDEQRALRRLEQQKEELKNEIAIARARGDEQAARAGQSRLGDLNEAIKAQEEQVAFADEAIAKEKELGEQRRKNLEISQQQERATLADQQAGQARDLENQLAGTGGKAEKQATALADETDRKADAEFKATENLVNQFDLTDQLITSTAKLADEAERYANALNSVGISSNTPTQSLRGGGVVKDGPVQVHSDEFLVAPRGTRVVSQAESRRLIQQALATRPELSFQGAMVRPQVQALPVASAPSTDSALIQEVRALRAEMGRLKVKGGPIYATMPTKIVREDKGLKRQLDQARVDMLTDLNNLIQWK